jgi:curved DNA-binding protein CbpA
MPDHERHDRYYERLEVRPDASQEEIVHAYRRLAHGAHPDTHPEDPEATRRFREITEAYEVLADPARRARYDHTRGRGTGKVVQVVVRQPGDIAGRSPGLRHGASEAPPVRVGATRRAGGPPIVAGPLRIESHGEDPAGGPPASSDFVEQEFLHALAEMLESLWRY